MSRQAFSKAKKVECGKRRLVYLVCLVHLVCLVGLVIVARKRLMRETFRVQCSKVRV